LLFSSFDFGTDLGPLEDALSQSELPPEFQEAILNFVSTLSSQELTAAALVMQLIIYLVIFSIFAMIGALIGVAVMHKKQAPPPPPPVQ